MAGVVGGVLGLAVATGTQLLSDYVGELIAGKAAADNAKVGASGLADAQGVLGDVFDKTTGRIKSQNELLILNARLTAINLRADALKERESSRQTFDSAGSLSFAERARGAYGEIKAGHGTIGAVLGALTGTDSGAQASTNLQSIVAGVRSGSINRVDALRSSERIDFSSSPINKQQFQQAIIDAATADVKAKIADQVDKSLDDGKRAAGLRQDSSTPRQRAAPRPRVDNSAEVAARKLAEENKRAGDQLERINVTWGEQPTLIKRAADDQLKITAILDQYAGRQDAASKAIVAQAKAESREIEEGKLRPLRNTSRVSSRSLASTP